MPGIGAKFFFATAIFGVAAGLTAVSATSTTQMIEKALEPDRIILPERPRASVTPEPSLAEQSVILEKTCAVLDGRFKQAFSKVGIDQNIDFRFSPYLYGSCNFFIDNDFTGALIYDGLHNKYSGAAHARGYVPAVITPRLTQENRARLGNIVEAALTL